MWHIVFLKKTPLRRFNTSVLASCKALSGVGRAPQPVEPRGLRVGPMLLLLLLFARGRKRAMRHARRPRLRHRREPHGGRGTRNRRQSRCGRRADRQGTSTALRPIARQAGLAGGGHGGCQRGKCQCATAGGVTGGPTATLLGRGCAGENGSM